MSRPPRVAGSRRRVPRVAGSRKYEGPDTGEPPNGRAGEPAADEGVRPASAGGVDAPPPAARPDTPRARRSTSWSTSAAPEDHGDKSTVEHIAEVDRKTGPTSEASTQVDGPAAESGVTAGSSDADESTVSGSGGADRPRPWPGPSPYPRRRARAAAARTDAGADADAEPDSGAGRTATATLDDVDTESDETATQDSGVAAGAPSRTSRRLVRIRTRTATWRRVAAARSRLRWVTAALAVLAVLAAVGTSFLYVQWRHAEARATARTEVPSVAKTSAAKILSYDYHHVRADADAAAAVLTGDYRTQYLQSMNQVIVPQAQQVKATVRAEVVNAGVTDVSDDGRRAVVLVFANQTVTNTSITGSRVDQVRVRLTMVRERGSWRVSRLDSL